MRILVTGGAGFIGSHLCERLLGEGHEIGCIDNFCDYYDPRIKRSNIAGFLSGEYYELFEGDIRDQALLDRVFAQGKFEMVIHLAAMAGVRPSIENPTLYQDVNCTGTLNLLEACRQAGITRLIYASSSSVYGNNPKVPFSEEDRVDFPISPYAASKKAGELLCHTYHHLFDISCVALRFFTVYGPRQRPDLAIHKFTRRIMEGTPIQVYGDGSSSRDYTYVDDIVDGIVASIGYVMQNHCFEIVNLGESQTITLAQLLKTLEDELGKEAIKEMLPMQPGDVDRTFADVSKAKRLLGYNPGTAFKDGIHRFVKWYNEYR